MTPEQMLLELDREQRRRAIKKEKGTVDLGKVDVSKDIERARRPEVPPDSTPPTAPLPDSMNGDVGMLGELEKLRAQRQAQLKTMAAPSSGLPDANAMTMPRPEDVESPLDFLNTPTRALAAGLTEQEFSDKDAYLLKKPTEAAVGALEAARDKRRAELQGYDQPAAPGGVPIRYDVAGKNPELAMGAIAPGMVEQAGRLASDPTVLAAGAAALAKGGVKLAAKGVKGALESAAAKSPTLEGIKEGLKSYGERKAAARKEILSPTLAPDLEETKAFGKSIGLTDEELKHPAIEFGGLSEQNRAYRTQSGREGGTPLLNRHKSIMGKTQKSFDDLVSQTGGGAPLPPKEAGSKISEWVQEGKKRILGDVDLTHNEVVKRFPGLAVSGDELTSLNSAFAGAEKWAKGTIDRAAKTPEGKGAALLKGMVDNFRKTKPTYKQLNELRDRLGSVAFLPANTLEITPKYVQQLRDLYGSLNDALIGTLGKQDRMINARFKPVGQEGAVSTLRQQLIDGNQKIRELILDENSISKAIGNEQKAGEKVFEQVLGDSRQAQSLLRILTPEQIKKIQAAYLNDLVKQGKGVFTYKSSENALARDNAFLSELFRDNPEVLERANKIFSFGERIGAPVLPGSAGAQDFGGVNTLAQRLVGSIKEPITDIGRGIGVARARRIKSMVGNKKSPELVRKLVNLGITEAEINAALQTAEP